MLNGVCMYTCWKLRILQWKCSWKWHDFHLLWKTSIDSQDVCCRETIFIDCYLKTSMSCSLVRNDFVFLLFYYTMSILKKKFKGTIVVLSKQLLIKHLHFTTWFLFCFSKRTWYENVIESASATGIWKTK